MKPTRLNLMLAAMLAGAVPLSAQQEAGSPLPPVATVLERVAERARLEKDQDHEFKARYQFTRAKVTEYHNSRGELKKKKEKQSVNEPTSPPMAVRTEPSPTEKDAGTDAANVEVDKSQPVSDTHSNVRGKAFDKSEFILNEDLLGRFDFTLAGREPIRGRPALMVDFKPAQKKLPERNLKDRFINKAAGRVWVDEADYALVKADLHLTKQVNVVGGLVGAVRKFTFQFNRERTADGLWFTRDTAWHLEGRELFVQRVVDYHEELTGPRMIWERAQLVDARAGGN